MFLGRQCCCLKTTLPEEDLGVTPPPLIDHIYNYFHLLMNMFAAHLKRRQATVNK